MPHTTSFTALAISLSLLASTNASVHMVTVGDGGLKFSPNSTTAAVGDVVQFHYYPKNHSVAQGSFSTPCMSTSGFFSGYIPSAAGEATTTFSIKINDTNPIYFYCSQPGLGGHCAQGMVGCVNCPASGNSLAAYAMGAMKTTNATVTHPLTVGGGVLAVNSNGTTTSNTTATASATGTKSTSTPTVVTNGALALPIRRASEIATGLSLLVIAAVSFF